MSEGKVYVIGELTKPEVFQFGNLIIETLVNYPDTLDQSKVKKLAKLIPAADNPTLVTGMSHMSHSI